MSDVWVSALLQCGTCGAIRHGMSTTNDMPSAECRGVSALHLPKQMAVIRSVEVTPPCLPG